MFLSTLFQSGFVSYLIRSNAWSGTAAIIAYCVGFLVCILIPYLLGSVNAAILISSGVYHDDIRKHGSGNPGATNMLRTYGVKAGVSTFLGDLFKTLLAVLFGSLALGYYAGGAAIAGFFCVLGHVFPLFTRFQGGKGVASAATVIILLNLNSLEGLLLIAVLLIIFVTIVAGTKYVSLASVVGVLIYPVLQSQMNVWLINSEGNPVYMPFKAFLAFLTAFVVVFRHWDNLKRLRDGTESKISFRRSPNKGSHSGDNA